METIIDSIRAYDKQVFGCKNNERDVMISFSGGGEKILVNDLFLTQEQAETLLEDLQRVVESNQEGGA